MMRVITLLLLFVMLGSLTGCLVRTGRPYRSNGQAVRSCPPAHHWEGGVCVHNGNGRHRGHN